LVSNAMKYAPQSDIEISARSGAPGFWQLLVEDRGPGVPESHQRKLFKPFTRLGEIGPDDGMSSGLGLSLARQIVSNAGGQLWYEDREGGGARFVIELPAAERCACAAAPSSPRRGWPCPRSPVRATCAAGGAPRTAAGPRRPRRRRRPPDCGARTWWPRGCRP